MHRVTTALVTAAVLTMGLAGCLRPKNCVPPAKEPRAAPKIVVLSEVTAAVHDPRIAADRQAALGKIFDAGLRTASTVHFGNISTLGQSGMGLVTHDLKVDAVNGQDCERQRRGLKDDLQEELDTQLQTAVDGGADVLGGIQSLASTLDRPTAEAKVDVILMSSMLNGTEALDLRTSGLWAKEPDAVISSLKNRRLVPDCKGWQVYVVGPGRTGAGGLEGQKLEELRLFWDRYFKACGGKLWRFQGQLEPYPVQNPDSEVDGPDVGEICVPEVTLPAGVLFGSGQADLRPDSEGTLTQLLETLRRSLSGRPRILEIVGHTDSDGDDESNQILSEKRALAMQGWLAPRLPSTVQFRPYGFGEAQPEASNDTPENKARNRRVVLTVRAPKDQRCVD